MHALLESSGLDRYYQLRGERTLSPVAGALALHEQPWLEALRAERSQQGGAQKLALDVQGIQCAACVWLIDTLFHREPGAQHIVVNPALGRASMWLAPDFDLEHFVRAVESFGYRLGPANKVLHADRKSLLIRTGICGALAVNTMLLSSATYFGLSAGPLFELVHDASFVMATLSALVGGSYFVRRAVAGVRRGVLHLDLPIALGMGLAYAGSSLCVLLGWADGSYLDTVTVFIALMLVGRLLQERLVDKNRRALLATDGSSGLLARRLRDQRTELIACAELKQDDQILVCPGEIVPTRARLDDEEASCALDWINGESEPRHFTRGDTLVAGAINAGRSALRATALCGFERSDLDALLRDDASAKERLRGDFWDRLARTYSALVLVAAVVGGVLCMARGGSWRNILDVVTAVLVVTCPCAFGIATPLAYELAVAGLRRAGLFVREGGFFERCARIDQVVFDKTGTLTTGALALVEPRVLATLSRERLGILYDLCAQSNHPKSAAIARAISALDSSIALSGARAFEVHGQGMECRRDGRVYRLGSPSWAGSWFGQGGPVFSCNGQPLACLECKEVARPDAAAEVRALGEDGYELWIASGDSAERVHAFAKELALPSSHALGSLSPEQKRVCIEQIDEGRSRTLMIGDGINDGPALSRAACSGTPAIDRPFVPARVDFYFLTAGLAPVRLALRISKAVRRVVRNALAFAVAYNVFAVSLAYVGWMKPWLAAVLMPTSSLVVLAYVVAALSPRSHLWKS